MTDSFSQCLAATTPEVGVAITENAGTITSVALGFGALAVVVSLIFAFDVLLSDKGEQEVHFLGRHSVRGSRAWWLTMSHCCGWSMVFFIIAIGAQYPVRHEHLGGLWQAICFTVGAILASGVCWMALNISAKAASRTAAAANVNVLTGFFLALRAGAIMACALVGTGVLGVAIMYIIFSSKILVWEFVAGFALGASVYALFARICGAVGSTAADVAVDLVGRLETPTMNSSNVRNPTAMGWAVATNAADTAGLAADLFESYTLAIVAGGVLSNCDAEVACVFWIAGIGILSSMLGIFYVAVRPLPEQAKPGQLVNTVHQGHFLTVIIVVALDILVTQLLFTDLRAWKLFGCCVIGLFAGVFVGLSVERRTVCCCNCRQAHCRHCADQNTASAGFAAAPMGASLAVRNLAVGMMGVAWPTILMVATVVACMELSGLYGIALAAIGMLTTLLMIGTLAWAGEVAWHATALMRMVNPVSLQTSENVKVMSDMGCATMGIVRGLSVVSCVLTTFAIIGAYIRLIGVNAIPFSEMAVIAGALFGIALPFFFGALALMAAARSGRELLREYRRQVTAGPDLLDPTKPMPVVAGEALPNHWWYQWRVALCACQDMLFGGFVAVFAPIICIFVLGGDGLAGMLLTANITTYMIGLSMASPGRMDSTSSLGAAEAGVVQVSQQRNALWVTCGPAMTTFVKLMATIALVIAPAFNELAVRDPYDYPYFGFGPWGSGIAALIFGGAIIVLAVLWVVVWWYRPGMHSTGAAGLTAPLTTEVPISPPAGTDMGAAAPVDVATADGAEEAKDQGERMPALVTHEPDNAANTASTDIQVTTS